LSVAAKLIQAATDHIPNGIETAIVASDQALLKFLPWYAATRATLACR
jgi:hypothetical protein